MSSHYLNQWLFTVNWTLNTLRPRQNGRHFPDDIFKWIFLNENVWISINISMKFVPRGPINNILTLVQIMAWRRPGDKPLSEPMMVRLPTHICVTRPQWVKNNLHRKFKQNGNIFIHENAFENVICKMTAILFKHQWVNKWWYIVHWTQGNRHQKNLIFSSKKIYFLCLFWPYIKMQSTWDLSILLLQTMTCLPVFHTLRQRQNSRHFPDNTEYIFLNEKVWILLKISLKFVPSVWINNIPALVQIMAWHQIGDMPLTEPMMAQFTDAYIKYQGEMS